MQIMSVVSKQNLYFHTKKLEYLYHKSMLHSIKQEYSSRPHVSSDSQHATVYP